MPRPPRLVPLSAILLGCAASAAAQEIRFDVVPHRLDNGLEVLVVEDHSVPAISYYTFFRVGSRNERPGRTGISHLFEHLMFNGAEKYGPGEFDRQLESRGGVSNGFTAQDLTGYYEAFPSEALELVIDMEADRMRALRMSEAGLASEREVVKEERRLRVDNSVRGAMFELLNAMAYVAHPYQWPVVGWMEDLDAITVDDCRAYFRTHYAPNNAVVIVAGDVRPARAIDLIVRAYGAIPAQEPAAPVVRNEPPQQGERRAVIRRAAQLPAVAVAYHVPGTAGGDDAAALDLLQVILGEGDSSRLVRTLVHDRQLATGVFVNNEYRIDPSLFVVHAEAKPGVAIGDLEAALHAEMERVGRAGVGDAELVKARNQRTVSMVRSLKTSGGKAEQLGLYEIYFGGHANLFKAAAIYGSIGGGRLKEAAARAFRPENRTVVTLVPAAAEDP